MSVQEKEPVASKIEIAKSLKQMKAIATPEQYAAIHNVLGVEHDKDLALAVSGLGEEDEFLLMCMLMGTSTHLAPIEQRPSVAGGHSAPDLLARFQPSFYPKAISSSSHNGYKCFIEIKSTKKNKLHFGGKQLRSLRQFADAFQLPLVFAVRFLIWADAAVWVIVEDKERAKSSLNIEISDWISGLRPILWNEEGYILLPGTYFQATYLKQPERHGIWHQQYGEQIEFQFVTHKGRFNVDKDLREIASAFFECYNLKETKCEQHGDYTYVAYVPQNMSLSVCDLIYGMNRLPRNEAGNLLYDAGSVLRKLADGQKYPLIT